VQRRVAQVGQLLQQVLRDQLITEHLAGNAVGQQDIAHGIGNQRRHRQAFQAIGHKASCVTRTADGLLQGEDTRLQYIAFAGGCTAPFGQDFGFIVQACQLPTEIGEDHAEAAPVPDQITEQQTNQAGRRRPPVAQAQQGQGHEQSDSHAAQGHPQRIARPVEQQPQQ